MANLFNNAEESKKRADAIPTPEAQTAVLKAFETVCAALLPLSQPERYRVIQAAKIIYEIM